MKKIVCIYIIENSEANKVYIGQTTNYQKRSNAHFSKLRRNAHDNEHLQKAFNKYGEKAFSIRILKECKEADLDRLEKFFIAEYKSADKKYGYNIFEGGERPGYRLHPKEVREKLSRALKGRKFSDEHKKRIGEANKGRVISAETIEKVRNSKKKKHSQWGERNPFSVISNETAEEIVRNLLSGESVSSVARKYNITTYIVYNILENRSYEEVLPECRQKLKSLFVDNFYNRLEKAVEYYLLGNSQNKAAKKFNVSRNSIRSELKKRGIDTKIHKNQFTLQDNPELIE